MASQRGGRRPEPTPSTSIPDGWVGCEDRVAWLLRINRIYGPDEELAVGANFARAFSGGPVPRSIDGAQVTRWERASQRAAFQVIRRYEEVLNLPSNRIVAVADVLYRETRGAPGRSYLDRGLRADSREVHRRTEQLLDRACGTA